MYPLNRNTSRSPNSRNMDCDSYFPLHKYLSRFRGDGGKLCDIKIQVQQHTFHAHRVILAAACEYFETMFGSNFQDSGSIDITLQDVDAAAFEAILECIYSGHMPPVNAGNIYNLFTAAHYLGLRQIVDICEKFLTENTRHPPLDLFEIFSLTLHTSGSLKDELSRCVLLNFKNFIHDQRFLEVSYDGLKLLLEIYRSSDGFRLKDEKFLSKALIRWINHSPQKRKEYFTSFAEAGHFDQASTAAETSLAYEDIANEILQEVCVDSPNDPPTIHVFADYQVQPANNYLMIFSLKNDRVVPEWSVSSEYRSDYTGLNARSIVTCTTIKDIFYCFKRPLSEDGGCDPVLYSYSSLNFPVEPPKRELAAFPKAYKIMDRPQLRAFGDNSIYLYTGNFPNIKNPPRTLDFRRCVYQYNCSANKWLSIPEVNKSVRGARLVTTDDLVYLIGGVDEYNEGGSVHQVYDPRSPYWLILVRSQHKYKYDREPIVGTANGRIYVHNAEGFEEYDPKAGRWIMNHANIGLPQWRQGRLEQLISYEDKLYFFYNTQSGQVLVHTYDLRTRELSEMAFPDVGRCVHVDNAVIF